MYLLSCHKLILERWWHWQYSFWSLSLDLAFFYCSWEAVHLLSKFLYKRDKCNPLLASELALAYNILYDSHDRICHREVNSLKSVNKHCIVYTHNTAISACDFEYARQDWHCTLNSMNVPWHRSRHMSETCRVDWEDSSSLDVRKSCKFYFDGCSRWLTASWLVQCQWSVLMSTVVLSLGVGRLFLRSDRLLDMSSQLVLLIKLNDKLRDSI